MTSVAAFQVDMAEPTEVWESAITLLDAVHQPRSFVVTLRCLASDERELRQRGESWKFSTKLDREFSYLPEGEAGAVVTLPTYRTHGLISRIVMLVRPFGEADRPASAVVGPMFYSDGTLPSSRFLWVPCVAPSAVEAV